MHYRIQDSGSYKITQKIKNKEFNEGNIFKIHYRPFDSKHIYYDSFIISRPAQVVMKNLIKPNFALLLPRQSITGDLGYFITK